jgi:hypothetical protein
MEWKELTKSTRTPEDSAETSRNTLMPGVKSLAIY